MSKIVAFVTAALFLLTIAAVAEDKPIDSAASKIDPNELKADVDSTEVEIKTDVAEGATKKAEAEKPAAAAVGTIGAYMVGEWIMAPGKNVLSGDIMFRDDGTYEKNEKHSDGAGVGIKGEYKLYTNEDPCGIDLCAGKCGRPGSEWTTLFGIVRILGDGRVEILTSRDSKRPTAFAEKPDERYTMVLTRKPAAKQ